MHNAHAATANLFWVTKKRSRKPELQAFGQWLERLRGRKVSREQISIRLAALGVPLGGSTLAQYEKGTVWAPDPGVLAGLATIYGVSLDGLVAGLRANRADPKLTLSDLLGQGRTAESGTHLTGVADAPAEARIRELEDRLAAYQTIIRRVRTPIAELIALVGDSDEGATPARKITGRRRRD